MKDKKVIATMGLANCGGIGIISIDDYNDKIKFAYFTGDKCGRVSTSTIRTNSKGQPYFYSCKRKYYLDDFIRVN